MTSLWLQRRRVGSTIPIPRASSGMVFLALTSTAEAAEMRTLIRQRYPEAELDESLIEQARRDGYAFSPQDTREQSVSLPIFVDGKIAAVLLMIFMARVHTHDAVVLKYVPRLRDLAAKIGARVGVEADAACATP